MTAARNNGPAADRRGSAWPVAPRETTARSDGYGSTWTERPAHGGGRSAEALDRDPVSGSGVSVGFRRA